MNETHEKYDTISIIIQNTTGQTKLDLHKGAIQLFIIKSHTKYRIQHENKQTKKPTSSCKRAK